MFWISKESTTNKREINACSVYKTIHNFIIDKKQLYIKDICLYAKSQTCAYDFQTKLQHILAIFFQIFHSV